MNSFFDKIIKVGVLNPKKIFLIDSLGALISTFLLGFVFTKIYNLIGFPITTLYFLASIPIFFIIYNLYCYFIIKDNVYVFLKGIAIMNLTYNLISLICVFFHYKVITSLGWIYIFSEILIVCILAFFELKISNQLQQKTKSSDDK